MIAIVFGTYDIAANAADPSWQKRGEVHAKINIHRIVHFTLSKIRTLKFG